ncbi:hypothetical protein FGADI_7614 [Fusarium gaditjirri]|uniref:Esterase n=1 Tax=Fusarium gaditjirri TaxID=282569 RepID=A0A8H4T4P5_9HYPO|nr:hypothetical protein FGADI_7614 [Fusarium gaditjirri]
MPSNEVPYTRDVFYIGGRSAKGTSGTITVDQIYLEKLTPTRQWTQKHPLVFFHGGGLSGSTWLNTPDNREGWASYFTMRSYAKLHTQWPGTGADGDPVSDQFKKSLISLTTNFFSQEKALRADCCVLLSLLGEKDFLVSNSLGSRKPLLLSNDCPEYIAGSINIEADTSPFWSNAEGLVGFAGSHWGLTNTLVTYDTPVGDPSEVESESVGEETLAYRNCYLQVEPARKLPQINKVPYLLLTGEASVHITYDHCCKGHFLRVEKNNMQITGVVDAWIQKKSFNGTKSA